jgi:Cytochrome bd terminal oxidase subunit I
MRNGHDRAIVVVIGSGWRSPGRSHRSRNTKKMTSQTFIDLSRWQFATTAAFHMTFPALSVGLAIFVAICYGSSAS